MKYKDFEINMVQDANTVTLYVDPNDNYISIFGVCDAYINQDRASLDEIAAQLRRYAEAPDAQLTVVYNFDSTVKVVLTIRDSTGVNNYEFWGKSLENCID